MEEKDPEGGAGGEQRRSINADTAWEEVPWCELGGVLDVILKLIKGLRAKFGVGARILI